VAFEGRFVGFHEDDLDTVQPILQIASLNLRNLVEKVVSSSVEIHIISHTKIFIDCFFLSLQHAASVILPKKEKGGGSNRGDLSPSKELKNIHLSSRNTIFSFGVE